MKKAIVVKRGQRKLTRQQQQQAGAEPKSPAKQSEWTPHNGTSAIDPWGVAIRKLQQQGKI